MVSLGTTDVLIIDDDKEVCELLKEYCEAMKCFRYIVMAHDGSVATQKLQNQKFGLVILDMNMPKKSGLDLIKEFEGPSENTKDKILVVSGTLEKDLIAKVVQRGVKNFLVKPFDEAGFKEKVTKMLS